MNKNEELKIKKYLLEKKIPPRLCGFDYLVDAIYLRSKDSYKKRIVNGLYQEVAKKYNTTNTIVERGIRHAIIDSYDYDIPRPTNSEFIAQAVLDLELEGY